MVFHRNGIGHEVGILVPQIAPLHTFSIRKKEGPYEASVRETRVEASRLNRALSMGSSWHLDVIDTFTENVRRNLSSLGTAVATRRVDGTGFLDSFNWIADFESAEFHGGRLEDGSKLEPDGDGHLELPMTPNLLNPIIHLSSGRLYTKYKIENLKRKKGGVPSPVGDFGFMTETVGLDITLLGPREELVLSVQNQAQNFEVLRVPYGGPISTVIIENVIPEDERHAQSHFQHYYSLFPTITDLADRYQIEFACPPETTSCSRFPLNRHPVVAKVEKRKKMTIGDYPCGGIFLGIRTQSLK